MEQRVEREQTWKSNSTHYPSSLSHAAADLGVSALEAPLWLCFILVEILFSGEENGDRGGLLSKVSSVSLGYQSRRSTRPKFSALQKSGISAGVHKIRWWPLAATVRANGNRQAHFRSFSLRFSNKGCSALRFLMWFERDLETTW